MSTTPRYHFKNISQVNSILRQAPANLKIIKDSSTLFNRKYFDTFDWRLFHNKMILYWDRENLHLSDISLYKTYVSQKIEISGIPKFWWELPNSELQKQLKTILDVRALIQWIELKISENTFKVLNEDDKTVLKLKVNRISETTNQKRSAPINLIELITLKGYLQEQRLFERFLLSKELKEETQTPLQIFLEKKNVTPGQYSSKINVRLRPSMTVSEALIIILRQLLETMKQNIEGIRQDIDSEFLHDFRVSIRRTRAALSQIKGIFSRELIKEYRKEFSSIQKMTNRLRDLDVYLLNRNLYQLMLPEDLHEGLIIYFKDLNSERVKEQKKVVKFLNSYRFKKILQSWEKTLSQGNDTVQGVRQKPISDIAKTAIFKRFKNIANFKLNKDLKWSANDLHRLRIECKKLRYLLEFFASLFPGREISILVKQLKNLQDILGFYNDCTVQKNELTDYLGRIQDNSKKSLKIGTSIGGLITELSRKQSKLKKNLIPTFNEFMDQKNVKIFHQLFK